jgi:hypothetical protein
MDECAVTGGEKEVSKSILDTLLPYPHGLIHYEYDFGMVLTVPL